MNAPKLMRLLVFSTLFWACLACWTTFGSDLSWAETTRVSGQFATELDDLSISMLKAQVSAGDLHHLIEGEITVNEVQGSNRAFLLQLRHPETEVAVSSFEQTADLLQLKVRQLAVAELELSRSYVDELRSEEVRNRRVPAQRSASTTQVGDSSTSTLLGSQDLQRAVLLRQESDDLSSFLQGVSRPNWLEARLDREALGRAREKLRNDEAELDRLTQVFRAESRAVAAQHRVVEQTKAELLNLELNLAAALLESHRIELEGLEEKTLAAIANNEQQRTSESADDESPEPTVADWLDKEATKLEQETQKVLRSAELRPLNSPVVTREAPWGYRLAAGSWGLSLLSLLGVLLCGANEAKTRGGASKDQAPMEQDLCSGFRLDASQERSALTSNTPLSEPFFQDLYQRLSQALGRPPSKLLILGADGVEQRASLSLSLAKSFARFVGGTRPAYLIDFDFENKALSRSLSQADSLGISDLLNSSLPAEEFFASVSGEPLQFAPAGTSQTWKEKAPPEKPLQQLFNSIEGGLLVVDASFTSPLGCLEDRVDLVLCLARPNQRWNRVQEKVLRNFRDQDVPLWVVVDESSEAFPLR